MVKKYCTAFDICLSSSDWIAVWSGAGGILAALAAFFGAIVYEAHHRRERFNLLRNHLRKSLQEMQNATAPFLARKYAKIEFPSPQEQTATWKKVIAARSAVRWALANPIMADSNAWVEIDLLDKVFDVYEHDFNIALEFISRDRHNWRRGTLHHLSVSSRDLVHSTLEKL